jgi:tetratricopeptide (TPR) repeat protein
MTRFVIASCSLLFCASPVSAALTEAPRLAAVYASILAAQFDRAEAQLARACPPAPVEACASLGVVSLWWQIQLTAESTALDDRFSDLAAKAVAANERWTRREPNRGEAWFYLAGSYAPLVQWRVLRGERVAAARDGKKIKDALERALQLDPALDDAYFGIGLYHYYADVAPTAAKLLRWLLFLPGGDRVKGLQEMLQARQRGVLLNGEADYQLHLIYLWYEQQPTRALELLRDLDSRYPTNPIFIQRIAVVEDEYRHDRPASALAWQTLLDRARAGRVPDAARRAISARLSLAAHLDAMYETDHAIEQLLAVVNADPQVVSRADRGRAQAQLGVAYDRLGQRDNAVKAYTAALTGVESAERGRIREALRRPPDATAREAYRLSLEGWRAFERGAFQPAMTALARAVELDPLDQVAHYRFARVLAARGEPIRAKEQLENLIRAHVAPAFVLAPAYVAYAQLLERDGDRSRAIENYRAAADLVGGDTRARDDARAALRRLRAI